jgi:hypothetical protein
MGVHLTSVHLTGVYLTSVHLIGVHLAGVHLIGIHFMVMYLTGVHLMGVYLLSVLGRTSCIVIVFCASLVHLLEQSKYRVSIELLWAITALHWAWLHN